jgi:hypothetical protein
MFNELASVAGLLNKNFGVTKLTNVRDKILVTLSCGT